MYIEEARIGFFEEVLGFREYEIDTLIVNLDIDFMDVVKYGDRLEIGVRVVDVGSSSIHLGYRVVVDRSVAAEARSVQVVVDSDDNPREVPDDWRRSLEEGL